MTERTALRLRRPLRSIRLHTVPSDPAKTPERVRWLVDLNVRAEAERDLADRAVRALEVCAASIADATAAVPTQVDAQLNQIAGLATDLGLALAREVVGELVDRQLTDPVETVKRCLAEATHGATTTALRVFLSPDDLGEVTTRFASSPDLEARIAVAEFVADETLQHGCVRIETDAGQTMYDPMQAIDRICAEVRKGIGT